MEKHSLEHFLNEQTRKLEDLKVATDLIQNKSIIQEDLVNAYGEVCSIAKTIQDLRNDIKIMQDNNDRCSELSIVLKSLDNQILHMKNNIPTKIQEYLKFENPKNNDYMKVTDECTNNALNNITVCNTEMTNNDYTMNNMKSCKKILFNEPEVPFILPITEDEYSKIPKYIIGRYSLEILNNLVSAINQVLKAKYSIIALGKNGARKKGELDAYLHYTKQQISLGLDQKNTCFFTSEDYEKYNKAKLDKTKLNLIIALRHCKKLREIRTAKTVYYALVDNS